MVAFISLLFRYFTWINNSPIGQKEEDMTDTKPELTKLQKRDRSIRLLTSTLNEQNKQIQVLREGLRLMTDHRDMAEDRHAKCEAEKQALLDGSVPRQEIEEHKETIKQLTALNTRQSRDITELRHLFSNQGRRISKAIHDLTHQEK